MLGGRNNETIKEFIYGFDIVHNRWVCGWVMFTGWNGDGGINQSVWNPCSICNVNGRTVNSYLVGMDILR